MFPACSVFDGAVCATADYMNPQQPQAHSDAEFQRWGKVISSAKIQGD